MLGVHTLVAEDSAHLVHAVHTADDKAFKVKLGLNTQIHIDIKRIVVGRKGACGCTDLKGYKDRRVHLKEAACIKIGAQLLQDLRALDKGVLDLGIHDEVYVSLAVTCFLVL